MKPTDSAYPQTSWSLLLTGLSSNSEEAWTELLNRYRKPIARSLARLRSARDCTAGDLATDFFGWFFATQGHLKLKKTDGHGRVYRFRGYLKYLLRAYLRDTHPKRPMGSLDSIVETTPGEQLGPSDEVSATLDREFCRELVQSTLDVMKRDAYSSWRAFLDEFGGLTLSEVSERLKADPDAKGTSVTTAHRERSKAHRSFRNWLLRFRLEQCCLTREDALEELSELTEPLAEAIADYRDEHAGELE